MTSRLIGMFYLRPFPKRLEKIIEQLEPTWFFVQGMEWTGDSLVTLDVFRVVPMSEFASGLLLADEYAVLDWIAEEKEIPTS